MSSDSSGLCSEFDLTAASLPQREIHSVCLGSRSAAFRWSGLISEVCSLTNCPLVLLIRLLPRVAAAEEEPRKHLHGQIDPVLTPSRLIPTSTAFRWSSPALSRLRLFSLD